MDEILLHTPNLTFERKTKFPVHTTLLLWHEELVGSTCAQRYFCVVQLSE